jgi:hypothetical protein
MLLIAALACAPQGGGVASEERVTAEEGVTLVATNTQGAELATQFAGEATTAAADIATGAARAATDAAMLTTATPTPRPPTPTHTSAPTSTPTLTPTPDAAQLAMAACLAEIVALAECVNGDVIPIIFPDGAPNRQVANNSDPTTLWRDPNVLAKFVPGVTMVHNYYTRVETCPLGMPCVLHLLMIEFNSQEDALAFFEAVTQSGMPGEVILPAPNAEQYDASKCAEGERASGAAGAPPFAVIYCSISEGVLHWGFNLSAYEALPEGFVEEDLDTIMDRVHAYLSVWQ